MKNEAQKEYYTGGKIYPGTPNEDEAQAHEKSTGRKLADNEIDEIDVGSDN